MLNKLIQISAAALLLVFSTNAVLAKATPDTVVEILKLSGLTEQVRNYPKSFNAGLRQAFEKDQQATQEIKDAFYAASESAIKPSAILLDISKSIISVMEESELQEMLDWYRSDLGKKIIREEKLASSPEAAEIISRDQKILLDQFQRAGFARNIEKLYGTTEFAELEKEDVIIASQTAASASQSAGDILDPEQFRDQVSVNLIRQRPDLRERIVASYVYSHRNIDLRDLIKYEMFLSADATVKFNRLMVTALGDSFTNAFKRWSEEIQISLDKIGT